MKASDWLVRVLENECVECGAAANPLIVVERVPHHNNSNARGRSSAFFASGLWTGDTDQSKLA